MCVGVGEGRGREERGGGRMMWRRRGDGRFDFVSAPKIQRQFTSGDDVGAEL